MSNLSCPPSLWRNIKRHIVRLKVWDIAKRGKYIYVSLVSISVFRSLFHSIGNSYVDAREITSKDDIQLFGFEDVELISACSIFNEVSEELLSFDYIDKEILKVVLDERIYIHIKSPISQKTLDFELNEKKLSGLMLKYKSEAAVRKMIKSMFDFEK